MSLTCFFWLLQRLVGMGVLFPRNKIKKENYSYIKQHSSFGMLNWGKHSKTHYLLSLHNQHLKDWNILTATVNKNNYSMLKFPKHTILRNKEEAKQHIPAYINRTTALMLHCCWFCCCLFSYNLFCISGSLMLKCGERFRCIPVNTLNQTHNNIVELFGYKGDSGDNERLLPDCRLSAALGK